MVRLRGTRTATTESASRYSVLLLSRLVLCRFDAQSGHFDMGQIRLCQSFHDIIRHGLVTFLNESGGHTTELQNPAEAGYATLPLPA